MSARALLHQSPRISSRVRARWAKAYRRRAGRGIGHDGYEVVLTVDRHDARPHTASSSCPSIQPGALLRTVMFKPIDATVLSFSESASGRPPRLR